MDPVAGEPGVDEPLLHEFRWWHEAGDALFDQPQLPHGDCSQCITGAFEEVAATVVPDASKFMASGATLANLSVTQMRTDGTDESVIRTPHDDRHAHGPGGAENGAGNIRMNVMDMKDVRAFLP